MAPGRLRHRRSARRRFAARCRTPPTASGEPMRFALLQRPACAMPSLELRRPAGAAPAPAAVLQVALPFLSNLPSDAGASWSQPRRGVHARTAPPSTAARTATPFAARHHAAQLKLARSPSSTSRTGCRLPARRRCPLRPQRGSLGRRPAQSVSRLPERAAPTARVAQRQRGGARTWRSSPTPLPASRCWLGDSCRSACADVQPLARRVGLGHAQARRARMSHAATRGDGRFNVLRPGAARRRVRRPVPVASAACARPRGRPHAAPPSLAASSVDQLATRPRAASDGNDAATGPAAALHIDALRPARQQQRALAVRRRRAAERGRPRSPPPPPTSPPSPHAARSASRVDASDREASWQLAAARAVACAELAPYSGTGAARRRSTAAPALPRTLEWASGDAAAPRCRGTPPARACATPQRSPHAPPGRPRPASRTRPRCRRSR